MGFRRGATVFLLLAVLAAVAVYQTVLEPRSNVSQGWQVALDLVSILVSGLILPVLGEITNNQLYRHVRLWARRIASRLEVAPSIIQVVEVADLPWDRVATDMETALDIRRIGNDQKGSYVGEGTFHRRSARTELRMIPGDGEVPIMGGLPPAAQVKLILDLGEVEARRVDRVLEDALADFRNRIQKVQESPAYRVLAPPQVAIRVPGWSDEIRATIAEVGGNLGPKPPLVRLRPTNEELVVQGALGRSSLEEVRDFLLLEAKEA